MSRVPDSVAVQLSVVLNVVGLTANNGLAAAFGASIDGYFDDDYKGPPSNRLSNFQNYGPPLPETPVISLNDLTSDSITINMSTSDTGGTFKIYLNNVYSENATTSPHLISNLNSNTSYNIHVTYEIIGSGESLASNVLTETTYSNWEYSGADEGDSQTSASLACSNFSYDVTYYKKNTDNLQAGSGILSSGDFLFTTEDPLSDPPTQGGWLALEQPWNNMIKPCNLNTSGKITQVSTQCP
jgi:hypothetical protein